MNDSTKTLQVYKKTKDTLKFLCQIDLVAHQNLLELLLANDLGIDASCGGNGICTTCRVFIKLNDSNEALPEKIEVELERSIERDFEPHERLACQIHLNSSAQIILP